MDKYTVGILLTGIVIPLAGLYVRRRQAKIDLDVRAETKALDAPQVTIGLLTDQLAKRERELTELRAADRVERDEYLKTLTAMKGVLDQMAATLEGMRMDERAWRSSIHGRLDKVDERLIKIETRLEPS